MAVYSGTWLVRPAPLPDQPYLYTDKAEEVYITQNQTVGSVDFELLNAAATIHGILYGPDGRVALDASGWGKAVNTTDEAIRNGAPVLAGEFDILVPGSATYSVSLRLADGASYVYTGTVKMASVAASGTQTVTFDLVRKNAKFRGALHDIRQRTESSIRGVPGHVWVQNSDGLQLSTGIDTGNGTFTLPVPADVWALDYSIQDEQWAKVAGPRAFALGPGQVQDVQLPIVQKDGVLTGTVLLPNGTPAKGATAVADGLSSDIRNLTFYALAGADGTFSMTVPHGLYLVRATRYKNDNWINPAEKPVTVPPGGAASVTLQYRAPDLAISGLVTLSGTTGLTGTATVFGWTTGGSYNKAIAPLGGAYTMPVISNTVWHLAAVYETSSQYWKGRARAPVTTTNAMRDLQLLGPFPKPGPVSVLFNPTVDQDIEIADGTRIHIPAGAMPVSSGNVLLNITSLAGAPHHQNGDVLGLTYAFEAYTEDGQPITDNFNQDVGIVLKYNPLALVAMGLDVNHLRPAYFSTTTNSWTTPDSFIVDEVHNEISMQIDHFTRFGALGVEGTNAVFLPLVLR